MVAVPFFVLATITVLVAPLIVGRSWVVSAIAGPVIALLVMQATGATVTLDDGTGPAFNYRTIFFLIVVGVALLLLGSLRWMIDDMRRGHGTGQLDHPG